MLSLFVPKQSAGRYVKHTLFLNILVLFSLLITLNSCVSVSPVSSKREQAAEFASVIDAKPEWVSFADGIDYFHGRIVSPRIEFWALQIDLEAPGIDIVVRAGVNTFNVLTLSTRVSSFVRDNNLLAGINAVPFDISSSKEGQIIRNMGLVISGGKMLAPLNPHYDVLVFYKSEFIEQNGRAAIVRQASINSPEKIENAVGGFLQILKNGELVQRILNLETRHPRSAAGICENGKYLYLLVIDGRQARSIGATEKETAQLLRLMGSLDGINLDGGGSSALALRYPNGNIKTVNTPIHNRIPGMERAVAGCIGVRNELKGTSKN